MSFLARIISLQSEKFSVVQFDLLAQLVEHIPFKDGVLGSNPRQVTKAKKLAHKAGFFGFIILLGAILFHFISADKEVNTEERRNDIIELNPRQVTI